MKINKTIFFAIFLVVINISAVFAEDNPLPQPPQQTSKTSRGGVARSGENLPGGPIDESLVYLVVAGIALGIVILYKDKIKKASV